MPSMQHHESQQKITNMSENTEASVKKQKKHFHILRCESGCEQKQAQEEGAEGTDTMQMF